MIFDRIFVLLGVAIFFFSLPTVHSQSTGDSLLAHWTFDEPSGSVARDETGRHNGFLEGEATFAPSAGNRNGAVRIGTTTDRVRVPAFDVAGDEITISAWIFVEEMSSSNNSDEGRIVSKASGTSRGSHYWMLGLKDAGLRFRLRIEGRVREFTTPSGLIVTGRWTYVAAVYDGAQVRLYVDRNLVLTNSQSGTIDTNPNVDIGIGNQASDAAGPRPLIGRIDDVKIFDRAVTRTGASGSRPSTNDLLAYWPFDENAGTTAFDEEDNFDGTLHDGVSFEPNSGYRGGAVRLDGNSGRIALPTFDLIGEAMTIAAWINLDDISGTNRRDEGRIISKATGTGVNEHVWMLSLSDGDRLRVRLKTRSDFAELETPSGTLYTGNWIHVAATYDGSVLILYVDGFAVASTSLSGAIFNQADIPVAIGNQPDGNGERPLAGRLDELYLYERALSSSEISAMVFQGSALPVQWISVAATEVHTGVRIDWEVADQRDNAGFYVERAIGGSTGFEEVGFVPAHVHDKYVFTDRSAPSGQLLYRLRQVDHDGTHDYSTVVSVEVDIADPLTVFPNPATSAIQLSRSGPYRILDGQGRPLQEGDYREGDRIDLSLRAAGHYTLLMEGEAVRFFRH
jgi:hypothetical protein